MANKREICYVCLIDDWDKANVLYGDWINKDKLSVHYFCLLSAQDIPQKGSDKEGIHGFLTRDILLTFKDRQKVKCYLCDKVSAATKCAHPGCERTWHYPCGTRGSCMTRMCGRFNSYCHSHVKDLNGGKKHDGRSPCSVCYKYFGGYDPSTSIISSCCLRLPDWNECFVHKQCVVNYTKNAGYDSMCINCPMNGDLTKAQWQNEMRKKGIYIPLADAVWEQESQFKDQVKNKCEFPKCPRKSLSRNVFTCFVCGCFPRHLDCARVQQHEDYFCPKCYDQSFVERVPRP